MLKVMTLVGTRPELIKMSRVIAALDRQCQHILVHSGQNYDYELNQVFFDDLEKEKPDALMLYGDTNSCLAVISAKRRKIPVFHMEAGNRCFDQRVPEELNRKVLDHLSDINMVLTEHARRYLIAEGVRPETIIKTGSHMDEVLQHYMPKIQTSDVLLREKLEEDKFFIVSAHREENVDTPQNLHDLFESLNSLAEIYQYPIIVSVHPHTRNRLENLGELLEQPLIRLAKPFGLLDYIKLQMAAFCVVSDSGSITEEASLLNLPAIMIRNTHERLEGMDEGTVVISGLKKERVLDAVRMVTTHHVRDKRVIPVIQDYQPGSVSKQIVRVVLSYIDYINRTVWSKP